MYDEIHCKYDKLTLIDDISDEFIREMILYDNNEYKKTGQIDFEQAKIYIENIFNSLRRLGRLQPLLEDESINEIMVNGYENIFIERNGNHNQIMDLISEELLNIIQIIVSVEGVNTANPIRCCLKDDLEMLWLKLGFRLVVRQ